jgi:hypothetical protein
VPTGSSVQRVVLKNKVPRFLAMVGVPIEEKQKGKKITPA